MEKDTKYCTSCWRKIDANVETCECGARFSEPPAPPEKEGPKQVGSIGEQREVQVSGLGAVEGKATRRIGLGYLLGWLVGGAYFLAGVVDMVLEPSFGGLLVIAGALLLLPPFNDFLKNKYKVELSWPLRVMGFFLLIYIGSFFVGAPTPAPLQREILNMSRGEFLGTFGTHSRLTTTQQEARFEEIKGKYVRWTCPLMDASENRLMFLCTGEWAVLNQPDTYVTLRADQTQKIPALKKYSPITFIARLEGRGITRYDFGDGEIINAE